MSTPELGIPSDPRTRLAVLPQLRHWIIWPLALGILTVVFGFTVKLIPGIVGTELRVDQLLSRHHDATLNWVALAINSLLSPLGIVVILALSFLFLLLVRRCPVNAFAFASVVAFGWLSSEAVKLVVAMPRPDGHLLQYPLLVEAGHDSFPSGHTTFAVAFVIAAYLLARETRWAILTAIVGVLFAVAVAGSRLYIGVHYPSDVIGSLLIAVAAIAFYTGLWNRYGLTVANRVPLLDRFGPIPPAVTCHCQRRGAPLITEHRGNN